MANSGVFGVIDKNMTSIKETRINLIFFVKENNPFELFGTNYLLPRSDYFPIQNFEKIFPKTSSLLNSPDISPRYSKALRSS